METINAKVGQIYRILSNQVDPIFNGIVVEPTMEMTYRNGMVSFNLNVLSEDKPVFNGETLSRFQIDKGQFVFKKLTKKEREQYAQKD